MPPPPPLFRSGCGCWKLQARLDLYMLGQCLLEDAMLLQSALFIDGIPVALSSLVLPSARQLWWFVIDRWVLAGDW